MIEKTVNSWPELQEALFEGTWSANISRHRSEFAYRGVQNEAYKLQNSLSRLGNPYKTMEKNLIKQFKKYAYPHVSADEREWHLLSYAQHHGLPTRLLDWTYSPLIALHFATANLHSDDSRNPNAAVWRVNYAQAHALLQTRYRDELSKLGAQIFTVDSLSKTIEDLDALDGVDSPSQTQCIFFEPPALDERIINQFAYFSALSDPFTSFDDWLNMSHVRNTVQSEKIIIPNTLLWEVRDKLDQSNINERLLFPGLDGLCKWLRRHYMPR